MTISMRKTSEAFFQVAIEEHLSAYPSIPSFFLHDSSIIEIILDSGLATDNYEATEVLEQYCSFGIKNINDEWYCTHDPLYGLWIFNRVLTPSELARREEAELSATRNQLRNLIHGLSGTSFEDLIFELFRALPQYEDPIARQRSHDGGYEMDIRFLDPITNTRDRILVQAKHIKKPVSVSHTRELIGTLAVESKRGRAKRLRGLMISLLPPSPFSEEAADNSPHSIDFLSSNDLVELMITNGIGCRRIGTGPLIVDRTFWKEIGVGNQ